MLKKLLALFVLLLIFLASLLLFSPALRKFLPIKPLAVTSFSGSNNLDALRALPYLSWSAEKARDQLKGVMHYDQDKAFWGYNLYSDENRNANLIDMEGRLVHQWHYPPVEGQWEHIELLPGGELLAICSGKLLVKLDKDSRIIWQKEFSAHHDLEILPDGSYLVCSWKPVLYKQRQVRFDSLLHLSSRGEKLAEFSTYDHLDHLQKLHLRLPLDLPPLKLKKLKDLVNRTDARLKKLRIKLKNEFQQKQKVLVRQLNALERKTGIYRLKLFKGKPKAQRNSALTPPGKAPRSRYTGLKVKILNHLDLLLGLGATYDYYHLNTIEVLPETPLGQRDPRFKKGNYLICLRNVNLILILAKDSRKIVWSWGKALLDHPHMPTMLPDGNLLVFDNGLLRGYSRILEIAPPSGRIVWEYRGNPPESFYSPIRGSNQRLPNRNTLICESERGHAFEVTSEGEIVWDYWNPEINEVKSRKVISRMIRIPRPEVLSWLKK